MSKKIKNKKHINKKQNQKKKKMLKENNKNLRKNATKPT